MTLHRIREVPRGEWQTTSAVGLAATLLFRGFSYWLPMVPGIILARRETRA
jgi:uncharacterized membrane protein YbhN (UPF0104 family)